MPFTPVIPSSYQTDRQDLNDALAAIIDAFIQSEDYAVGRVFASEMPDSFTGEGPMIVLGDITERIRHTMSLRITVFSGDLFYVDWFTDRAEYNRRVNTFADRMRDLFTYNVSTVNPSAELRQVGFEEGEFRQGQLVFGAPSVKWEYTIQEGYQ
jgi:hypothetical protein